MVAPYPDGTPRVKFGELFRKHYLKTISYCAVFWSFGMCVAFLGPTLIDLECRLESVFSTMSWVFFSQSLFILIGTFCGGFLVQRFGNNKVLLVSSIMLAVTLSTIPACSYLLDLSLVLAVMGFFMGTIDTVANISMIQLYGRNVAPFLQALHFCYGIGAFISPLVAEPFLLNKDCTQMLMNDTEARNKMVHSIDYRNITRQLREEVSEVQHHSRIQYAFWILAAMQTPVIVLLIVLVVREVFGWNSEINISEPMTETKEGIEMFGRSASGSNLANGGLTREGHCEDDRPHVTRRQVILITATTTAIIFIYDGLQAGYGGYIFSYGVKSIAGMSMNEAAYLNACFWGTFAFGRLVSIGLATRLAPSFMLICNITGCSVAIIMMLSLHHDHTMLYIGTAVFGTFLSSIYPTAVTLAETYIDVTSFITSCLVAGAAAGEMLFPVIIGHEFDAFGPLSLLVTCLVLTMVSCVLYGFLHVIADQILTQSSERSLMARIKMVLNPRMNQGEVGEETGILKHHVMYYKRMKSETSESGIASPTSEERNGQVYHQ